MSESKRGRQVGTYLEGSLTYQVSELETGDAMLVLQASAHTRSMCLNAVKTVQKVKPRAMYTVKTFTASHRSDEETFKLVKIERVK